MERKSLFLPTLFAFLAANLSRRASGSRTSRSWSAETSARFSTLRTCLKVSTILLASSCLIYSVLPSCLPLAMLIIVAFPCTLAITLRLLFLIMSSSAAFLSSFSYSVNYFLSLPCWSLSKQKAIVTRIKKNKRVNQASVKVT